MTVPKFVGTEFCFRKWLQIKFIHILQKCITEMCNIVYNMLFICIDLYDRQSLFNPGSWETTRKMKNDNNISQKHLHAYWAYVPLLLSQCGIDACCWAMPSPNTLAYTAVYIYRYTNIDTLHIMTPSFILPLLLLPWCISNSHANFLSSFDYTIRTFTHTHTHARYI